MKQELMKRSLALALSAVMVTGLTACGGDEGGKTSKGSDDQRYFRADYIGDLPETLKNVSGNVKFSGDTVYYQGNNSDYTKNGIYSYNLTSKEEKTYWEGTQDYSDPLAESVGINTFFVDQDGNVYLYIYSSQVDANGFDTEQYADKTYDDILTYMMDNWGYENQEAAEKDWKEYYEEQFTDESGNINYGNALLQWNSWDLPRINKSSVRKLDASGNEVYQVDISTGDDSNISCNDIAVDKNNCLYMLVNKWSDTGENDEYYVQIFDESGSEKGKIKLDYYADMLIPLGDGTVAIMGWGDSGEYELSVLDTQGMKTGEKISLGQGYVEKVQPVDEKNLLMNMDGTIYQYNIETQEKTKYLSWLDCNISRNNVSGFGMLSDGNLAVLTQSYNYNSEESLCEIAVIKEIDASEAAKVTNLTLACISMDDDLEAKMIEYNKKHEDYHINVKEFYNSDSEVDYEDAMNSYVTAIASDPDIDIVVLNTMNTYSDVMNYAAKGLLIDLSEFLDSDAEINKDDFISSIVSAFEYDGKLVALPTGFGLQTVVGKASDVGEEPGWTLDEMKALLASKPEGTQLFYGRTRDWALEMCLNLGYRDFIDRENATCNFDTQEFADVLEFANMFPEEFEWKEDEDETVLMNTGKVLLSEYYLSDFNQIQMYTEIFGDKLTYIGYPTTEGNGAMLSFSNAYGITKNCKEKEAAWELMREFFLPKDVNSEDDYYGYGFSIRKDDFDKFCENAMKEDEFGGGSWGWGSFEVELKPATQEQVDEVKDLVNNTTAVSGSVSTDIMNIIKEEAAAYFSGQKSAEDVAGIIQSRMQVYLSETK